MKEKEFNFKEKLRELLSLNRFGKGKDNDDIFELIEEAVRRLTPKLFHDIYEEIAEEIGWETHRACRVKFDELPELNQLTMIKTIQKIKNKIFGDKSPDGEE